jgi:hypothetical protein
VRPRPRPRAGVAAGTRGPRCREDAQVEAALGRAESSGAVDVTKAIAAELLCAGVVAAGESGDRNGAGNAWYPVERELTIKPAPVSTTRVEQFNPIHRERQSGSCERGCTPHESAWQAQYEKHQNLRALRVASAA